MSVGVYADHHVPGDVVRGLRLRDVDCPTVAEDGRRRTADDVLLDRAMSLGRVMLTMDEDLLTITARWLVERRRFAGLIYGHQLGVSVGRMVFDVEFVVKASAADELVNQIIYLPL